MSKMKFPSTTQHLEELLMNRIRSATSKKLNEFRFYKIELAKAIRNDGLYRKAALRPLAAVLVTAMGLCLVFSGISGSAKADDWSQINGPTRNGVVTDTSLFRDWESKKLQTAWSREIGQGNSGPIVVGDKLYIFHRPGEHYLLEALNKNTGAVMWQRHLPAGYTGGVDGDLGPKSVPVFSQGKIFLLGAEGHLFCIDADNGELQWDRELLKDYRAQPGYFGVGSSPIVVDGLLVINVGGRDASVVALDINNGEEAWRTFDDDASYSSPIEIELDGIRLVVVVTRLNLVGIESLSGKVVFKTPFGKSGPTVNGAIPVLVKNDRGSFVFVSAAYGVGARWYRISNDKIETIWKNDRSFSSQYSTPVEFQRALFGTAGREDYGNGSFRCFDPSDGKVLWEQADFPVGHTFLVDSHLLVLDCKGNMHVLKANREKFERIYYSQLFDVDARSMPAVSNGLLFARSNAIAGKGILKCVVIGKPR